MFLVTCQPLQPTTANRSQALFKTKAVCWRVYMILFFTTLPPCFILPPACEGHGEADTNSCGFRSQSQTAETSPFHSYPLAWSFLVFSRSLWDGSKTSETRSELVPRVSQSSSTSTCSGNWALADLVKLSSCWATATLVGLLHQSRGSRITLYGVESGRSRGGCASCLPEAAVSDLFG